MLTAGASRQQLERTLKAAYAGGLISEHTYALRLDEVLRSRLIDPQRLVGDLRFRGPEGRLRERISNTMHTVIGRVGHYLGDNEPPPLTLLALDWTGEQRELVIGRGSRCDLILSNMSVSRRHARLLFRDGKWVLQDLASMNGTVLNGRRIGRCELRPGDSLFLGGAGLRVD